MSWRSHVKCPYSDCGSSDAFSYNTESKAGKCHSCEKKYPAEKGYESWALEEYPINQRGEVMMLSARTEEEVFEGCRGITLETMKFFNVSTVLDRSSKPIKHVYPYPSGGRKIRVLPKEGFFLEGMKTDEFFGQNLWNTGTGKIVTICEGELDAMSAYQMCNNPKFPCPFISLPSATPSRKLWEKTREYLNGFDKIILSVDSDEAGNAVAHKIAKMFPNKVYRVIHDKYKDANDFLQAGAAKEFVNAWWGARKFTPDNVLNTTNQFLNLYNKAEEHVYVQTGIPDFDDLALGLMQGHFTVFKAKTGIGKTEFMRYLQYRILSEYPDVPIAIWHLEETKLRSLLGLCSYELQANVTRKDLIVDNGYDEIVQEAISKITKDEMLFQFYLNDEDDPLLLLDQIRYLSQACGCKYIMFEPIQDVAASKNGDESKETFLADMAIRLSKLAAELNVGLITIAHTNDDGAVKYCKMIEQRASVVVELQRDNMAEDEDDRNTTRLYITKNRPTGATGYAGEMSFSPDSFTLRNKWTT